MSHFRCTLRILPLWTAGCFTDPGSVPSSAVCLSNASDEEELRFCSYCNAFKPPRAHHCSQCKRCIVRMDHHCPWTNNCIGYRNMKYFLLFLGYVVAMCAYMFLMDFFRILYIFKHVADEPRICCLHLSAWSVDILCTVFTMSLSCIFVGFAGSMLDETLQSIRSNTTSNRFALFWNVAIDRLQGKVYGAVKSPFV